jgi:hypothetical protein
MMIAFLYENSGFVSSVLGVLLGLMLVGLYNKKMSARPQSRWAPTINPIAISTRTAIIWISVVLIALLSICIGGILEHQYTGLVVGMIVGTFVTALVYWGLIVLTARLTSPKKQA